MNAMYRSFLSKHSIFRRSLCLLCVMLICTAPSAKHTKNEEGFILIISAYNPDTQRMAGFINSIESILESRKSSQQILIEDMGFRGLLEANQWVPLMQRTINKYRNKKVNAIILLGQEAWASYLSIPSPMKGVPIFTCFASKNGIDLSVGKIKEIASWEPRSIDMEKRAKEIGPCGGTLNVYDVEKNIQLITSLCKSVSTIAFLSDNSYGGISLQAHFIDVMKEKFPKMKTILLDGRKEGVEKIKERIKRLPNNSALLIGTWRIDNNGRYFLQSTLNELVQDNKKVPTFTLTGVGIGMTTIGGYIPQYETNAEMIVDRINNFNGPGITDESFFSYTKNVYTFDAKKLAEYGIQSYELPKNSIIVDDVTQKLNDYRNYIVLAIAVSIVLTICLIFSIVLYYNNRKLSKKLKENEANLIAAKEKAESSEQLKTAFLANMSHEIRTPLNAIVGFANLIQEVDSPDELDGFISVINTNTELLLKLVTDVLDFSRLEAGYIDFIYADVEVNRMLTDVVSSTQLRAKEGVTVAFHPPYESCIIHIDKNRLLQIITNFLGNAVKFTTKGSITPGYKIVESGIMFFVSDTGKGLPAGGKEQVFDRFAKFDSFVQGTGLGLSICKTLVEAMNGTIGVDSEEGVGSTFWCILPCTPICTTEKR